MAELAPTLDIPPQASAGDVLHRIRAESRDTSEKGRWFEQLFMRVALQEPEFEIEGIWRWPDWPERERLTGLDGRDRGIDLVARRTTGEWVAIQCKCYDDGHILRRGEVDKFLGGSQQSWVDMRWVVATCRWGPNAEAAILGANPQVGQVDFRDHLHVRIEESAAERPVQAPWPLQEEAIDDTVEGLTDHDRGRLIMACGTGKTFTSLRAAERIVEDGGRILFAAPTIALVSQARREWLRHTTRPLHCVVVCSDATAGGRHESEDIRISELECPVTTDPGRIADTLIAGEDTRVVFCTYQSLRRVMAAQADFGAPAFDLAIADEAHRTTGALVDRMQLSFQEIHDEASLHAHKRLYMTATPRLYSERSKSKLADQGVEVVDMADYDVYGPELHRLPFKKAVENDMLSDYRVIVLGVDASRVSPALRRRLEEKESAGEGRRTPTTNEMTRVLGVSLALNGVTEGADVERPGPLPRTLAFANSIKRSRWYADAIMDREVLSATTRRMEGDARAMKVVAKHLDARASALERNQELRALAGADREGECRIISNVRLFTEGVDVPSLDAVAFLDPRDSQVDIVQAVGRVMRKAPGKRFGYIIVPVVIEPGNDVASALARGTEGFGTVGRVLRALQAHDGRLIESPATFVKVYGDGGPPDGSKSRSTDGGGGLRELDLKEADTGIYAHVAAASGLGRPGQVVAGEISDVVRNVAGALQREGLEDLVADALDLTTEADGGSKGVCTIAALLLCNACLLQRRLRDEPELRTILGLDKVSRATNPAEVLAFAWEAILDKDYAPVFQPALAVLKVLPGGSVVENAIRSVVECANRIADSLSELGYDHAGPLYHRILGTAKSDGAFYTNNLSALMLARLALSEDFADWSDPEAVAALRIMDPACGTGTLLMAALRTARARCADALGLDTDEAGNGVGQAADLHRRLVEDCLCGLDINQHAIQLAACNLTLGAPTVDYRRMNLVTMPHGPQPGGELKAGSLEVLTAAADVGDLRAMIAPDRDLDSLEGEQVNDSAIRFRLRDLDLVIMNAPFTANENRSRKYGPDVRKAMQRHELDIQRHVEQRDQAAGRVITANAIRTFFTPLADKLLRSGPRGGALAMVIPTTACTGTGGVAERRLLASRFHVEVVVTSHDPRRPNFSENTSIHESLIVCRRRQGMADADDRPTLFVGLRRMPSTPEEAIEVVSSIEARDTRKWITLREQPTKRVREGDWRPCQFLDPTLVEAATRLEGMDDLVPLSSRYELGPAGQRIRDAFGQLELEGTDAERGEYRVFWSRAKDLRDTMEAEPEQAVFDRKPGLAARYRKQAGNVLLAAKFDTLAGRLLAIFSGKRALGSMWVPIQAHQCPEHHAKALVAWLNSTPGALGFLFRRSTKLTNPGFSQAELATLPVPDFMVLDPTPLVRAFERVGLHTIGPWKDAVGDEGRKALDEAAAATIGLDPATLGDWRALIAAEPTISGAARQAPAGAGGLGTAIHEVFKPLGGVELDLPAREPMREPPRFD